MAFDWSAFIQTAKAETRERLQALNDGLLRLEGESGNTALLDDVFRHAHSIKGAARMVGLDLVGRVAHGLEDLLGAVRSGQITVSSNLLDLGFRALDLIQQLLEDPPPEDSPTRAEALITQLQAAAAGRLPAGEHPTAAAVPPAATASPAPEATGAAAASMPAGEPAPPRAGSEPARQPEAAEAPPAPAPEAVPDPQPEAPRRSQAAAEAADGEGRPGGAGPLASAVRSPAAAHETMRVPTDKVDHLLALVGELTTLEQQERTLADGLQGLYAHVNTLYRTAAESGGVLSPDEWMGTARALHERTTTLARLARRLGSMRTLHLREVRSAAMDLRLLPASTLFERFPRPVRDLARAAGKQVQLLVEGQETRLDKRILDGLYDPVLHLLRNAIDHGIELPAERRAAGKAAAGTVILRAVPRGREVLLQVSDDGRGIDVERVKHAACDRAILTQAEAASASQDQLLELLFRPGFSTSRQITEVSGRGVGLDVVRTNVRDLKGLVRIETHPGAGTTFVMEIPLTLATTHVFLFECGSWVYAVPGGLVRGVSYVPPAAIRAPHGQPTTEWEGHPVPIIAMEQVLGTPRENTASARPAVLVQYGNRVVGLLVDRLIGEEEVVLKPLEGMLRSLRLVLAGTVLGDGRIALLIHPDAVVAAGLDERQRHAASPMDAPARRRAILLADDTLTTREVERAILETAGYEVVMARDGQEALDRLAQRTFDLIVSDIEMPRLDGISLTRLVTSDARTAHIPIIIVSSFTNDDDRRRGLEAGASAYIVKSAFDQENLLDLIDRLIR